MMMTVSFRGRDHKECHHRLRKALRVVVSSFSSSGGEAAFRRRRPKDVPDRQSRAYRSRRRLNAPACVTTTTKLDRVHQLKKSHFLI